MPTVSTAPVTAARVRDGEPTALGALVGRRGTAVLAYCDEVAAPGGAVEAAGEAFARFRREVIAAPDPRALDPEAVLLRETRQAAAAAAPRSVPQRGGLAKRLGATCLLVPELLAARAEGVLTAADRLRLARHLERCESCREAAARFEAGEQAYRKASDTPPEPALAERLLSALRAAAPVAEVNGASSNGAAIAPEPTPPAEPEETPEPAPTLAWDAADVEAAVAAEDEPEGRRWLRVVGRLIIPAAVLVAAVLTAFAVAGVFGDGDPGGGAGSIRTQDTTPPPTVRVTDAPATTPLPEHAAGAAPVTHTARSTAAADATPAAVPTSAPAAAPESQTELSAHARAGSESVPTGGQRAASPANDGGFEPSTTAEPPPSP